MECMSIRISVVTIATSMSISMHIVTCSGLLSMSLAVLPRHLQEHGNWYSASIFRCTATNWFQSFLQFQILESDPDVMLFCRYGRKRRRVLISHLLWMQWPDDVTVYCGINQCLCVWQQHGRWEEDQGPVQRVCCPGARFCVRGPGRPVTSIK